MRDCDNQRRLVTRGANNEANREGVALEQPSTHARLAWPLREQPGAADDPTRDAGNLIEKRVLQRWASAPPVVARLMLELGDRVVEQVDAEKAGAHLPPGSKPVENRPEVAALRGSCFGVRQALIDLGAPSLRPLLRRQSLGLDLARKDPGQLGRQTPPPRFNLIREDTKDPCLNLRCGTRGAGHGASIAARRSSDGSAG